MIIEAPEDFDSTRRTQQEKRVSCTGIAVARISLVQHLPGRILCGVVHRLTNATVFSVAPDKGHM